jgi:hypothetical protein
MPPAEPTLCQWTHRTYARIMMKTARFQSFGENLWYTEGTVRFYGVPIQSRMAVSKLDADALWVWSPLPMTEEIAQALDELGRVAHVVSPNKIHNLGLDSIHTRYPDAKLWASPGLRERLPTLDYTGVLADRPEAPWAAHVDQHLTAGNAFFSEAVFFHRASRTLIVADLVENISRHTLPSKMGRRLAKLMRIYGRALPSPEFRMYTFDAGAARRKLDEINAWPFERILLAHGDLITENAHQAFQKVIDHLYWEVSNRPRFRRTIYEAITRLQ